MTAIQLASRYNSMLNTYGINTPLRLANFFAQIHHESGGFKILKENLNYSVDGLLRTFGRHRISEADARRLGRQGKRPANQIEIANILYGGRFGRENLGNVQAGDGSRFIGRGYKQVTGRANYTSLSNDVKVDYLNNPEWLEREGDAMLSACWFWKKNNCNRFADIDDVPRLTRVINGGQIGLKERQDLTNRYKQVFK